MSGDSMNIAVLATGSELLSGEMADTNTREIAGLLATRGFRLRESACVGDREDDIVRALERLAQENSVVIITGGLGPTEDDLTARAAARASGSRLEGNPTAMEQIRARFRRIGRPMHPSNEKQALLPQGATVLANPVGTAPGFRLALHGAELFFLPGVPFEMRTMLIGTVIPTLEQTCGDLTPHLERRLQVFSLSEPEVDERLSGCDLPTTVEIGYGVDFPLVVVKLRAGGKNGDALLDRAEVCVQQALGNCVIARGDETLAGNVGRLLTSRGVRLALAESCTGGLLSAMLTDSPGASAYLERTVVSYANSAKQQLLSVPADLLERVGAVSRECALAMAHGVRNSAGTDLGLAITGIAGPDGGSIDKPVGTVFLSLVGQGKEHVHCYRFGGDRARIRTLAAYTALDWLRRYLEGLPITERGGPP